MFDVYSSGEIVALYVSLGDIFIPDFEVVYGGYGDEKSDVSDSYRCKCAENV